MQSGLSGDWAQFKNQERRGGEGKSFFHAHLMQISSNIFSNSIIFFQLFLKLHFKQGRCTFLWCCIIYRSWGTSQPQTYQHSVKWIVFLLGGLSHFISNRWPFFSVHHPAWIPAALIWSLPKISDSNPKYWSNLQYKLALKKKNHPVFIWQWYWKSTC